MSNPMTGKQEHVNDDEKAIDYQGDDPAYIIADLLSAALMPLDGTWENARPLYLWERAGLNYLAARKATGSRCPISSWTAWLVDEGYPPEKAGAPHGKYWMPNNK